MFNKIIIIVFLFFYVSFYGQKAAYQKPNYKKIKRAVTKKKSDFQYSKLMNHYLELDNEMTLKEKRYLYFGYAFQKSYKPYASSKYKNKIRKLINKNSHNKAELDELLGYTDAHLKSNPFDIEILRVQVYAYKRLRLKQDVLNKLKQINIVKEAILSTGDGKTKTSAYHIINIKHEHELLKLLGYKQKGRHLSMKKYEYVALESNADSIKGLYFNLSRGMKSINN